MTAAGGRGQPGGMRTLSIILALSVAACSNAPGDDAPVPTERGMTVVVACSTEYKTVTRNADRSRTETYEARAELPTDLDPTEAWRVSAVACDPTVSPPPSPCAPYPSDECDPRPAARCVTGWVNVADDGRLFVSCGARIHFYDANSTLRNVVTNKYERVTFHVAPAT